MEQLIDELIPRREAISAGDEEDDFRIQWQQEREREAFNEKDTHFSKLFTDDNYYQAAKEKNFALAEALDPEATAKRSLVNAYLEHRLGREIPSANFEPERDALVDPAAVADRRGLADHDAGAVVDEHGVADPRFVNVKERSDEPDEPRKTVAWPARARARRRPAMPR